MSELCRSEVDHSVRAAALRHLFGTADRLAEFLHQNYRAAAKSLKVAGPGAHNHGWCDCYGGARGYFLRRAEWLLADRPSFNGRVGKRWMSAKADTPPNNTHVEGRLRSGNVARVFFDWRNRFVRAEDPERVARVTHWRPL